MIAYQTKNNPKGESSSNSDIIHLNLNIKRGTSDMKKISILLLIVVAAWLGTSAFIGSQIKSRLGQYLDIANESMEQRGIKYSANIIDSSLFSTDVNVVVEPNHNADELVKRALLKSTNRLAVKIEHGPIFFQNGLGFGLAKIHNETPLKQEILQSYSGSKIDEDNVTLMVNSVLNFTQKLNTVLVLTPVTIIDKTGTVVKIGKIKAHSSANISNIRISEGTVDIPQVVVYENSKEDTNNTLEISGIRMKWNIEKMLSKTIMLGSLKISAEKIHASDTNITAEDPEIYIESVQSVHDGLDIMVKLSYDSAFGNDDLHSIAKLENIEASYKLGGLGIDGVKSATSMLREFQKQTLKQEQALQNIDTSNADALAQAMSTIEPYAPKDTDILRLIKELLVKNQTYFETSSKARAKGGKENILHAKVLLTKEFPTDSMDRLREIFKNKLALLNMFNIEFDISMQKEFVEIMDERGLAMTRLDSGVQDGYLIEKDGTYSSKITYQTDSLKINNKENPQILMMIKMALGLGIGL